MGYRSPEESLRARVQELEGELAEAGDKIARLEGRAASAPAAGAVDEVVRSRWLDAPSSVRLERTLPYAVSEEGYEAIAALLRQRLGVQVTQVGRTLTAPNGVFELSRDGDRTHVRMRGSWGPLALGPPILGSFAGLFGAGLSAALLHDLAHAPLWPALLVGPALGVGAALGVRRRAKSQIEGAVAKLRGSFEGVLELAEQHAAHPAAGVERARVAAEVAGTPARPAGAELEAELEAGAEAQPAQDAPRRRGA